MTAWQMRLQSLQVTRARCGRAGHSEAVFARIPGPDAKLVTNIWHGTLIITLRITQRVLTYVRGIEGKRGGTWSTPSSPHRVAPKDERSGKSVSRSHFRYEPHPNRVQVNASQSAPFFGPGSPDEARGTAWRRGKGRRADTLRGGLIPFAKIPRHISKSLNKNKFLKNEVACGLTSWSRQATPD